MWSVKKQMEEFYDDFQQITAALPVSNERTTAGEKSQSDTIRIS
jgi:hypothetical protein